MKKEKKETMIQTPAINVAIPNTIELKMKAILELSEAINKVADSLKSVNVNVTVANNYIHDVDGNGISIHLEEEKE